MDTINPIEEMEQRADKNLRLWRLNETTDPGHTKPVKLGRSFTSIDSYYQIKRATETFGPIGVGWGWDLEDSVIQVQGKDGEISMARCKVTLWYLDPETGAHSRCGPVVTSNLLATPGGRPDEDAFKKATTDAITKSLSYLGFSADIFMGLYDDDKYVSRLRQEFNRKADATGSRLPEVCTKALAELPKLRDLAELDITWKALQPDLRKLPAAQLDLMKNRFAMRKRQLAPSDDPTNGAEGPPPGAA